MNGPGPQDLAPLYLCLPWLLSAHPDNPVCNQTWRYSPPDEAFLTMPLAGVGRSYPLSPGTFAGDNALPFGLVW